MIGPIKFLPADGRCCRLCANRLFDSYGNDFCLVHCSNLSTRELFGCRCVDFSRSWPKGGA